MLLETFIESQYAGTCYLADNWIEIGNALGRARQDRERKYEETVKSIWMYPLVRNWRKRLFEPLPQSSDEQDGWEE